MQKKERTTGEPYPEDITNDTKVEIGVFSSFHEKTDTSQSIYQNTLTLLKTVDGKETIQAGKKDQVLLPLNDEGELSVMYSLLSISATTLYPIDSTVIDNVFTDDFPPVVIPEENADLYQLAIKFMNRILTFPSSTLATEYMAKLQEVNDDEKHDTTIIDDWLQTTDIFKDLTFDKIFIANSYLSTYPVSFLGGEDQVTFYMYQSNESTGVDYIGDVVIEKNSKSSLSVIDCDQRFVF